jgi:hypothetical protein
LPFLYATDQDPSKRGRIWTVLDRVLYTCAVIDAMRSSSRSAGRCSRNIQADASSDISSLKVIDSKSAFD